MVSSSARALTKQFYDWEERGRGWQVFPHPVQLEPPLKPFTFHGNVQEEYIDDGRKPSWLGSLAEILSSPKESETLNKDKSASLTVYPFSTNESIYSFSVSLPVGYKVRIEQTEQLLLMLSYCQYPVSFEIIATQKKICIQFVCRETDCIQLTSQIKAFFPEATVQETRQTVFDIVPDNMEATIIDYGFRNEFMCPVAMSKSFDLDPFTGLFGIFEHLGFREQAAIQVLFQGANSPWAESIMRSVMDNKGDAFFVDAPEILELAKEKVSAPLYTAVIRVIGIGTVKERADALCMAVGNAVSNISHSEGNILAPLLSYNEELHKYDVLLRQSCRVGMIINGRELATLVHFPSASVVSAKLERDIKKTKAAPAVTEGHKLVLGKNFHQGSEKTVTLSASQRLRHTHVIGATGTGKSTLLVNCITQDIEHGEGIAVLDPHGDLIESILARIPENRYDDVILIDPADTGYPVGFNILSAHSEIEKEILSSDLVSVFRRLSTSWGDQMNSVFANALLAFLESPTGGTLVDVRRFLVEKSFRDNYLKTVTDPSIVYYWQKEYPLLKSSSIGSILTRLDTFLRPKAIRNMVAQKRSLDFEQILDSKKILLVKLSQGLIGDENSYLLGTLFVSKIYQAAMARQAKAQEHRSDFYLYVDEFQNFITPSMSAILSGARKYHLGLVLAHQDMQQLVKQDTELASAVMSNAGTRVCFRVGDTDAKRFESGFAFFEAKDLQNLNTGEAITRVERSEQDFNLITTRLPEPDVNQAEETTATVISQSRKKYGTPKEEVEKFLGYLLEASKESEPVQAKETPVTPKVEKQDIPNVTEMVKPVEIHEPTTKEQLVKRKELSEHRYTQTLIKRMAEGRGYKASIEEPITGGRVDVSLERNGKKIACEVGVTTSKEWEVHNIEKCLIAGYDIVVAIVSDAKAKAALQKQIEATLDGKFHSQVFVMNTEALFQYLDAEIAKEMTTETRMRGYRVKVEYGTVSEEVMKRKQESITRTILDSLQLKK